MYFFQFFFLVYFRWCIVVLFPVSAWYFSSSVLQGQWQCVGTVRVSGEFPKGPVEFSRSFSDYISDDKRSITLS